MAKHKSTSKSESGNSESAEAPSFETSLDEVETIVQQLEDGDLDLAESLAQYERAVKHLKNCHQLLEHAERRVELLTGIDSEGNLVTQPFEGEDAPTAERAGTRRRSKAAEKPGNLKGINGLGEAPSDVDDPTSLF